MFASGVVAADLRSRRSYNNVMRVAIENHSPPVLSAARNRSSAAYDEAFQIPTEFAAELRCVRRVVAYESGIAKTVDPAGRDHLVNVSPTGWNRK